ncbi:MAG: 4Fe-4S dicluster domain-containing protein [Spirochaetales bacterium]|nr:MAG: 4Fe-4S dicluster domain-containing protein [Spirochaetales bacterium]
MEDPMPLKFNYAKCTGCELCQLACSGSHLGYFSPAEARLRITHDYDDTDKGIRISSKHCTFCKKCEQVCPTGAISNNGSWMIVDHDVCIGCRTCEKNCPTKIIFMNKRKKSVICDLCGGEPKCVEWCPKDVISLKAPKKSEVEV